MSYTKQNFTDGNVLTAAQLNAMDDQIATNETEIGEKQDSISDLDIIRSGAKNGDDAISKLDDIKLEAISPDDIFPNFTSYSSEGITVKAQERTLVMENVSISRIRLITLCTMNLSAGTYTFGIIGTLMSGVYLQALATIDGTETFLVNSKSVSTSFTIMQTLSVKFRLYIAAGEHTGETGFYLAKGDTSGEVYDGKKSVVDAYSRAKITEINNRNKVQDLLVEKLYTGTGTIVLLGNSITHGVGSSDFSNTGESIGTINGTDVKRNVGTKSWAAKFASYISENYGMTVINNGVSGIGIGGINENLSLLAPSSYDAIILLVGVNSRNSGKGEIVEAYKTLITSLKTKTKALVCMSPIPDNGATGTTMPARMNQCLRKACIDTGTAYVNLYSAFYKEIGDSKSDYFADTLHPNDNGHEKIYECVRYLLNA